MREILLAVCLLLAGVSGHSSADDWPQWLGPDRASVWKEDGIVERFPSGGLKVAWRVPIEIGYAGPAVAGGKVVVTDYRLTEGNATNNPGGRDKLEGEERILCFSADTGKPIWGHAYKRPYYISYPRGPRCTPTIDGERVYTLGAEGNLVCLSMKNGHEIWSKDLAKEYEVEAPMWGFAAHPLVDGDRIVCIVGGKGSVAVCFNKNNGKEIWRALSATEPGYCPPSVIEHAGKRQLIIFHPQAVNSLNPEDGSVYWSVPLTPSYGMSVTMPRKLGNYLYASGIGNASALLELDSDKPGAKALWRGTSKSSVFCCNSTPFLEDGIIYGNDCQMGSLFGVRIEDGERVWETFKPTSGGDRRASHGTAFIVKHKDRYFLFSETGDLILAQMSPAGYEETGRFHVLEPTNEAFGRPVVWSHPAFANRCVYARNDKELVCVKLAAAQ